MHQRRKPAQKRRRARRERKKSRSRPTNLVQLDNLLHAPNILVLNGPAAKELGALLFHIRIRQLCGTAEPESLKQGFICESPLETRTRILNEAIEKGQSSKLPMQVSVLQLLPDGSGGLRRTRVQQIYDLHQVRDATEVVFRYGLARESLDGDRHRRVRLLLSGR